MAALRRTAGSAWSARAAGAAATTVVLALRMRVVHGLLLLTELLLTHVAGLRARVLWCIQVGLVAAVVRVLLLVELVLHDWLE